MATKTFLLLLCFLPISCAFGKKSIATDQSALLALKSNIVRDSNSTHLLSNWTRETSVCNWIGVQCSSLHNRVVALDLSSFGLRGTIPPQIGNLSFLNSINVGDNNYQGQLPREMAQLRRLSYINFMVNNISGDIPSWLGSLPDLQYLNLRNNSFSGSLPSSLFNATKLEFLSLSSNSLNGYIPEDVGNLGNLAVLNLQMNQLEGSLPSSIFNLSSLQVMAITDNRFIGHLPLDICSKLPYLQGMYMSSNQFSGQIQSRFDNCSELQSLSLSLNNFTGSIPREIGNLTQLVQLLCGNNQFQGQIPPELGNLYNLEALNIRESSLSGPIPTEIGNLQRLERLELALNFLSGPIPPSIFNISSLSVVSFLTNNLTGSIPLAIGQQLPNLFQLSVADNKLCGVIPDSISNLTRLARLQLSENLFTGPIPTSLGNLRFLEYFIVFTNFLTTDSSVESSFLESLTNCRNLMVIMISFNPLNITLPPTIGNFSKSLRLLAADSCDISGSIPDEIGNLSSLLTLSLDSNNFTGVLPPTIQNLSNLQLLSFVGSQISGLIPNSLCNMKQLTELYFGENQLYGPVPQCFGNLTSLTSLNLESNELNSTLPDEIGNLRNLLVLDAHSNSLSGNITPAIGGLYAVIYIDLSGNQFSGNIPASIGGLGNLINLSLAHNQLHGPIPETFAKLISLETFDLSRNDLTGEISAALERLSALKYFNVSFNHFRGRVPSNGSFLNFTSESFMSNDALCGGPPDLHFPPCIANPPTKRSRRKLLRIVAYTVAATAALVILICGMLFLFIKKHKKARTLAQVALSPLTILERVSYYDIQRATNGFSESNLLGKGSFGSVYKAVLRDGTILAIKVFNQKFERALRSFETECEVISSIRHRNLLKVISSCTNLDFKALVLEYMPNGSLERWLYSHNHCLDFLQRLNIMIDVASALEYLHHGYTSAIVHCDLKPSNVLIDEQMIGHVSDFGISKLLHGDETMVQTMTLATIGYTAPEYGSEGQVSTSCDVYSFGILLMETFSRKKPTDGMFVEGWGLREMIMEGLQNSTTDFMDQNLVNIEDQKSDKMVSCIVSIMNLALRCCADMPEQRIDASSVLVELQKIKLIFLSKST